MNFSRFVQIFFVQFLLTFVVTEDHNQVRCWFSNSSAIEPCPNVIVRWIDEPPRSRKFLKNKSLQTNSFLFFSLRLQLNKINGSMFPIRSSSIKNFFIGSRNCSIGNRLILIGFLSVNNIKRVSHTLIFIFVQRTKITVDVSVRHGKLNRCVIFFLFHQSFFFSKESNCGSTDDGREPSETKWKIVLSNIDRHSFDWCRETLCSFSV